MIVRGDFPAQMKLDLFMKDIHLMQEAAAAVGAPLPFTDLAERPATRRPRPPATAARISRWW